MRESNTIKPQPKTAPLGDNFLVLQGTLMAGLLELLLTSTALGLKADSVWLGSKRQLSMHLREAEMRWCRRVAALEAQREYKAPYPRRV